ncbi:MAG: CPBP family intramembrane metalloprotease [Bacilli bacterium]|nr:CPBP family intramembrane metalloprotease [Bacilli bacterium]
MKDKTLNILKSIGIILLLLLFSSFFFVILNIDPNNISDKKYIIYLTISNIILLSLFIFIYRKTLKKDLKNFFKNFGESMEISIKYWLIGFLIMIASNLFITYILNKTIAGNEEEIRSYINIMPLIMIFNTVIFAPITEELAFRKSIKDVTNNKWIYILTSGLIFGFLHIISYINNVSDLVYLIPYGALGITFALLYYKTNNIFSTIMMHAIHNSLAVIVYLIGVFL